MNSRGKPPNFTSGKHEHNVIKDQFRFIAGYTKWDWPKYSSSFLRGAVPKASRPSYAYFNLWFLQFLSSNFE